MFKAINEWREKGFMRAVESEYEMASGGSPDHKMPGRGSKCTRADDNILFSCVGLVVGSGECNTSPRAELKKVVVIRRMMQGRQI
jgi:hypothetical protein